jgi:HemY protein
MKRTCFYLILLALSVLVGVQMYHHPGYVLISLGNWSIEMPAWFAALAIFIFFALLNVFLHIINAFGSLKYRIHRYKNRLSIKRSNLMTKQGLIDFTEGNWGKAENQLIKALGNSDTPLINYLAAARAAQEQGNFKMRDQYLREAQRSMPDAKVAIELTQAQLLLANKQYEQTLATLKHLHSLLPKHPYVIKLLLKVYLELRDFNHIIELLPLVKKHKITSNELLENIEQFAYTGYLLRLTKQSDINIEEAWRALPKNMQQQDYLVAIMALHLIEQNKDASAEPLIRTSLKRQWSKELTELYALCKADLQKQISFMKKQLALYPNKVEVLSALGKLCQSAKLWGQAEEYYSASLKEAPSAANYYELSLVCKALGKHELSQSYQQNSLRHALEAKSTLCEDIKKAPVLKLDNSFGETLSLDEPL